MKTVMAEPKSSDLGDGRECIGLGFGVAESHIWDFSHCQTPICGFWPWSIMMETLNWVYMRLGF